MSKGNKEYLSSAEWEALPESERPDHWTPMIVKSRGLDDDNVVVGYREPELSSVEM